MAQKFNNASRALLASGIAAGDTSLTVEAAKADLFPTANTGTGSVPAVATDWFKIVLQDSSGNIEIAYVRTRTAGSGVMSNVMRGQEGTTARAFSAGTVVGLRITALDVENSIAAASNSVQLTDNQTVAGVKTFSDGVALASNKTLTWNTSDLRIYHTSTNATIDFSVGNLYLRDNTTVRYTFERTTGNFTATGTVTGTNLVYNTGDQTIAGVKTFSGGIVATTGNITIQNTAPILSFLETDQTLPAGQRRMVLEGNTFTLRRNTAAGGGFSTEVNDLTVSSTGDFTALGNVTAYSDIRLKTDLTKIANALGKVNQLNGYTYTRIDTGERHTGVVAQEVRAVLPEAVVEQDDGTLAVAYGNMVGLLIEAVKELTARVEKLEGR